MGYTFETMSDDRLAEFLSQPCNAIVGTIGRDGSLMSPRRMFFPQAKYLVIGIRCHRFDFNALPCVVSCI